MNKYARLNQSSGDRAYFKFIPLVGPLLSDFIVCLFPADAALKHAIGPHENRARNVSVIRSCFLYLEHDPFTFFAIALVASSSGLGFPRLIRVCVP